MISIQSKWCDLIASGRKKIEVRKTAPKIDTPFKCYIYHTVTRNAGVGFNHWCDCWQLPNGDFVNAGGKVVGEFLCNKIDTYGFGDMAIPTPAFDGDPSCQEFGDGYFITCGELKQACLTYEELCAYGKGKILYGFHISDLVIYDTPKELLEFKRPSCEKPESACHYCKHCVNVGSYYYPEYECDIENGELITRPPQGWYYVEEKRV